MRQTILRRPEISRRLNKTSMIFKFSGKTSMVYSLISNLLTPIVINAKLYSSVQSNL